MRILGVFVMATGLLGFPAQAAQKVPNNAPPPVAKSLKAPSKNPLDAVVDDNYRREMSGEITREEAAARFDAAFDKATPEQIQEFWNNIKDRR